MMFGSVFRLRPQPGQQGRVIEHMQRWDRDRRPKVDGFVHSYLFESQSHAGELIGVAVFDSEANYRKNAEDPEQDAWYRELRAALEADPEWNDGNVVAANGR